jgi:hypothetical protein
MLIGSLMNIEGPEEEYGPHSSFTTVQFFGLATRWTSPIDFGELCDALGSSLSVEPLNCISDAVAKTGGN